MAQNAGLLNTAPPPIPGGFGNPTGINIGLPSAKPGMGVPNAFGPVNTSLVPGTMGPQSFFPANGISPTGTNPSSDPMSGLSTGMDFGGKGVNFLKELQRAYGKGTGALLDQMFSKGLFNPQVANALINAMQPMRTRGLNDIQSSFGQEGARFSSAAAIGIGDFESQFAANEQATLANLFEKDQQMQLAMLEGILPTLHKEEANSGGGWINKVIGGLEIAGGIAAAPFTGGASLGLVGSGISTMTKSSGGSDSGTATPDFATMFKGLFNKSNASMNPNETPSLGVGPDGMMSPGAWQDIVFGSSGAQALDSSSGDMGMGGGGF